MDNTKIIIEYYANMNNSGKYETEMKKEYYFIPLDIVQAIEKLLDNYRKEVD